MKWNIIAILYWVAWIIAFAFWEAAAGFDQLGKREIPMLTQVTVRWVPWWITLPFIAWLFVHFAVRYANPAYLQWLRSR